MVVGFDFGLLCLLFLCYWSLVVVVTVAGFVVCVALLLVGL